MDIHDLLAFSVKNHASDLHLSSGLPPSLRLHGDMRCINLPALQTHDLYAIMDGRPEKCLPTRPGMRLRL